MPSSTHRCFRCDRPLKSRRSTFCSVRCRELNAETYRTYEHSLPSRIGEDATYDPEDVLYGDYADSSERPFDLLRHDQVRVSVGQLRAKALAERKGGFTARRGPPRRARSAPMRSV